MPRVAPLRRNGPVGTPILCYVFARKQRVTEVQRRAFKGTKVLRYQDYSTLCWRRTYGPAASSSRGRIFHDLRVVSMAVYALSRAILVNYDLLFGDLLRLSMALCASHGGVATGQRQVGLVMVKR